ncbi:hypothetical protein HOY80DRAFT_999912 [Tuber brumale]|nr:hypothetical protein HOY80DRAFT_999912 [Tuber brumale]
MNRQKGKNDKVKLFRTGINPHQLDLWKYITTPAWPLLWPTCKKGMRQNSDFDLIDDNAPTHYSDITTLERVKAGISKVDQPTNSSNFIATEHLWQLMKSQIHIFRQHKLVTSISEMKEVLQHEGEQITILEVNKEISKLSRVKVKCIEQQYGNKFYR